MKWTNVSKKEVVSFFALEKRAFIVGGEGFELSRSYTGEKLNETLITEERRRNLNSSKTDPAVFRMCPSIR